MNKIFDWNIRTCDNKIPDNRLIVWCSVCGFEHRYAEPCPACEDPARWLPIEAIEQLAEEYGEDSIFANVLKKNSTK